MHGRADELVGDFSVNGVGLVVPQPVLAVFGLEHRLDQLGREQRLLGDTVGIGLPEAIEGVRDALCVLTLTGTRP